MLMRPASVCTPYTLHGLLTGRYCWHVCKGTLGTSHPLLIEKDRLTLLHLLKGEGYKTAASAVASRLWHRSVGLEQAAHAVRWKLDSITTLACRKTLQRA